MEENIVKKTCKELGVTQIELADIMGVAKNTATQWATQIKPPKYAIKFMELLAEHKKTKEQLEKLKSALEILKNA